MGTIEEFYVQQIYVTLSENDTAFFGPAARLEDYDVQASYGRFEDLLTKRLIAEYPNVEIWVEVSPGPDKYTAIGFPDGDIVREELHNIVFILWQAFGWLVEAH